MKIQWNKVTWYSKTLALVLFVALPFAGFYFGAQYGKAAQSAREPVLAIGAQGGAAAGSSTSSSSSGLIPYYATPSEWQVDANNTQGGFSIAYPIDFDTQDNYSVAPSTDWRVGANGAPGIKYFTLTVPRAFEPQTNFVDARLTVGASANNVAIAQCMASDPSGMPNAATSSAVVNGIDFTVFRSGGAGAGNYYDTTSYRTMHAGKCYAIEYTIHSAQIMNYPAEYHMQPYDAAKIGALMRNIIGTFKFM